LTELEWVEYSGLHIEFNIRNGLLNVCHSLEVHINSAACYIYQHHQVKKV